MAALAAIVAGCGGGGGEGNDSVEVTANINSAAVKPMVATLTLGGSGGWYQHTSASLPRAKSDWEDVSGRLSLPNKDSSAVYTVVVFNDKNGDGRFDMSSELLGFMDHFLMWRSGKWIIRDMSTIYVSDVVKDGHLPYIDCTFSKASELPISCEERDVSKKDAALRQGKQ